MEQFVIHFSCINNKSTKYVLWRTKLWELQNHITCSGLISRGCNGLQVPCGWFGMWLGMRQLCFFQLAPGFSKSFSKMFIDWARCWRWIGTHSLVILAKAATKMLFNKWIYTIAFHDLSFVGFSRWVEDSLGIIKWRWVHKMYRLAQEICGRYDRGSRLWGSFFWSRHYWYQRGRSVVHSWFCWCRTQGWSETKENNFLIIRVLQ